MMAGQLGVAWRAGNAAATATALAAIKPLLAAAADATNGSTAAWELLRFSKRWLDDMSAELMSPDLDEGHMADFTVSLYALLVGARSVPDSEAGATVYVSEALGLLERMWGRLGCIDGRPAFIPLLQGGAP